jgi:hypothetical protein
MQKEFTNYTLWTIFQEEFYKFTADDFKRIHINTRVKLRIYLLKKGVYIVTHNNKRIFSEVLFDLLQEEE